MTTRMTSSIAPLLRKSADLGAEAIEAFANRQNEPKVGRPYCNGVASFRNPGVERFSDLVAL